MSQLLDDDDLTPKEREFTLSSGAILAIFLGLVLSWGLFFALGFNMGSHKPSPAGDSTDTASGPTANFSSFKPSAGSRNSSAASEPAASTTPPAVTPAPVVRTAPPAEEPAEPKPAATHETPAVATAPAHAATTQPPAPAPAAPAPAVTGSFMVQAAAVSRQDDADMLLSALKAKGYAVVLRNEPQDKFLHIQVGPFSNRKDAEAMRQRLIADGYAAIIK